MGQKKTKLMLYSTLVEIEVEVGVELGNTVRPICLGFLVSVNMVRLFRWG